MNSAEIARRLYAIALAARKILEEMHRKGCFHLKSFPAGACQDTSILLAEYISAEVGISEVHHVSGTRRHEDKDGEITHAWLECCGFIVDITSDQFAGALGSVVVQSASEWHESFKKQSTEIHSMASWRGAVDPVGFPSTYGHLKIELCRQLGDIRF